MAAEIPSQEVNKIDYCGRKLHYCPATRVIAKQATNSPGLKISERSEHSGLSVGIIRVFAIFPLWTTVF